MQIKTFYETNFNFIRPLNYLNAISNATYELHPHILLICAIQLSFEKKWALLVTYQNVDFLSRLSKLSRITYQNVDKISYKVGIMIIRQKHPDFEYVDF